MSPAAGEINYSRVLRAAKELGYTGFVGLELRPQERARQPPSP
ncbi:MAG TPA: hypothetical protein VFB80_09170 [Pirellulaceae bacterium]|nr:hypothetical protein [Pirellulaceae bacterium]